MGGGLRVFRCTFIDQRDPSHEILRARFEADPVAWVLSWAILPEVDYIVGRELGSMVAADFRADVAEGLFQIDWTRRRAAQPNPTHLQDR